MLIEESKRDICTAGVIQTLRDMTSFASLLRLAGGLSVIAAMSAFLMQDWASGNDINRYYLLLSQVFLLACGGFGLSFLLKENKGARIFFGLGLLAIATTTTTLGALIYSTTTGAAPSPAYPDFAHWQASDTSDILLAFFATAIVSVPVAWFSFQVFARHSSARFTQMFLLSNLLLLIPVRESLPVGLLVALAIIIALAAFLPRLKADAHLRTPEGIFAMIVLLAPAALIMLRTLWFYPVDDLLSLTLGGIAFVALRIFALQASAESTYRNFYNTLSLVAALQIACAAVEVAAMLLPEPLTISAFGFLLAALVLDVSTRSQRTKTLVRIACMLLAGSHLFAIFTHQGALASPLAIGAGIWIIALAQKHRLRNTALLGIATILLALILQLRPLMGMIDLSNWMVLSAFGISAIILASVVERYGAILALKWRSLL